MNLKSHPISLLMEAKKNKFTLGFLVALFISIFLHLSFFTGISLYNPFKPKSDQIEIQIVEAPSKQKQQIVEQDKNALNDELDPKSKFLSANNQRVEHQTVAKNNGQFQNKSARQTNHGHHPLQLADLTPKFDISKAVHSREEMEKTFEKDPRATRRETKITKRQGGGGPSEQASQSVDYIKEIDPGLETLLSTREFVYFSYYSRIKRQLGQFWGPKVKEKLISMYHRGRQIASSNDKITRCLVTLDKTGRLIKLQIIGNSGIRELDDAAVEAFKAAAPFPNPPNGIVEPDGTIKIRWDFVLEV